MKADLAGTITVEALVALTILAAGVLGAAGTAAMSLRAVRRGDQTARAARLSAEVMAELRGRIAGANGECSAVASGTRTNTTGESVRWSLHPEGGGRAVLLEITFTPVPGRSRDSLWSFVRCF